MNETLFNELSGLINAIPDLRYTISNEKELYEYLRECCKKVHEQNFDERRWWIDFDRIVQFGDRFFAIPDFKTTGDEDGGWEPDFSCIREVEPKEVVTVEYVTKKD